MTRQHLKNYLRAHRRALGLSQKDMAILVGCDHAGTISNHEIGSRIPTLSIVLAYEVALGAPVRELFAGQFQLVEADVKARMHELVERLSRDQEASPEVAQKLESLSCLGYDRPLTIPLWDAE